MSINEIQIKEQKLISNIKENLTELRNALEQCSSHWVYEDLIYRFYYYSFKVYAIQSETGRIVELLKKIAPDGCEFCQEFKQIIEKGAANISFSLEHNKNWSQHTQCFIEAFLHAKFFLEMVVKYGDELSEPPNPMPSGWAAVLCLYGLR